MNDETAYSVDTQRTDDAVVCRFRSSDCRKNHTTTTSSTTTATTATATATTTTTIFREDLLIITF